MVISRFSTLSLLHMNMKLTTEFKVVYLQGHPYKISMRTLIKTTAVTIIGTRYYNGFGDPPSLDGYCYNLWHVYTDVWSRHRRLIRQRYAKVFSVPPIRDEGSSCRPMSNPLLSLSFLFRWLWLYEITTKMFTLSESFLLEGEALSYCCTKVWQKRNK